MVKTEEITNTEDVIDSRNIIERIDYLEGEGVIPLDQIPQDSEVEDEELARELQVLKALAEEAEDYAPDWEYGATLIRETYFEEYAQELVEDIGDLPKEMPSYIVIDWEATARNLMVDYTQVDFDGVAYLVR